MTSQKERDTLRLQLGINIQSVDDVERNVVNQANEQLAILELSKLETKIESIYDKVGILNTQLDNAIVSQRGPLQRKLLTCHRQLDELLEESDRIRNAARPKRTRSSTSTVVSTRQSRDPNHTTSTHLATISPADKQAPGINLAAQPNSSIFLLNETTTLSLQASDDEGSQQSTYSQKVDEDSEDSNPLCSSVYSTVIDDGLESNYLARIDQWARSHYQARTKCLETNIPPDLNPDIELYENDPALEPPIDFGHNIHVPPDIHPRLFEYQKTCLTWLCKLYSNRVGGVLADEMGLGKTIQAVAFLASLVYSKLLQPKTPILVVCPVTVMNQWVKEFHHWFPPMRVVILHSSGTGFKFNQKSPMKRRRQEYDEEDFNEDDFDDLYDADRTKRRPSQPWVKHILDKVLQLGHVVVTTYGSLRSYSTDILPVDWGYVVLDEGHKIRNCDAEITLLCKQLKTPHRLILSGTPVQNSLAELWSIFDFVYPGRLGTLPVFQTEFAVPINIGGYANASTVQVQTAYRCASVLRDLITPYMLRRLKKDVAIDLPTKSEQVLFCKLTMIQRQVYNQFLDSHETEIILQGKLNSLFGIDALRKICNHPCLFAKDLAPDVESSGKLVVVRELLKLWIAEGHKALLFCQTRQMLNIVQRMVCDLDLKYRRMDGATPVKSRAKIVDEFNCDPNVFLFLLTTKVGGLGVNLTGANRIIIFDPDWNPATDSQARERAWRIGQRRHVTIYRLVTTGTIEEKIYHRQIFKQHLSSKVLTNPKQRRYFKMHDLRDLFTLADDDKPLEETTNLMKEYEMGKKEKRDEELVEQLEGVSKLETFQPNDQDSNNDPTPTQSAYASRCVPTSSSQPSGHDDIVLSTLLQSASVQVAVQHDAVIDSKRPEMIIVEREAQRVAEAAIQTLRASRSTRSGQPVSVPTWTGRTGGRTFGGTSTCSKPCSSSSLLLQNMRNYQLHVDGSSSRIINSSSAQIGGGTLSSMDSMALIVSIRDFIAEQGNTASSQEIVRKFRLRLTADDVGLFRKMLQGIATFRNQTSGGYWCLKNEFRD